jgi:hypothetical protein
MGSDSARQEAVIVRPVAPGLEATTPLLTQSGRVFFCRLRSFQHTSMVAVTWDVPPGSARPVETGKSSALPAPHAVDVSRLHTAYVVEKITGNPPWLPLAVYDDGSKTVIQFRESLRYTKAPAVFGRHADGSAGVVEFKPYEVPDAPGERRVLPRAGSLAATGAAGQRGAGGAHNAPNWAGGAVSGAAMILPAGGCFASGHGRAVTLRQSSWLLPLQSPRSAV